MSCIKDKSNEVVQGLNHSNDRKSIVIRVMKCNAKRDLEEGQECMSAEEQQ